MLNCLRLSISFCCLLYFSNVKAENIEAESSKDLTQTALFVSLGSICAPATMTRHCNIRTASFPFDWIVSTDGEMFLELLSEDFSDFFNMEYLVRDDQFTHNIHNTPVNGNVLLNTYYHLEFLHEEGNWKTEFLPTMGKFKSRYQRRIKRFRGLRNYPGKVFFIRSAYPTPDPHRFFRHEENITISEAYSFRLYDNLKQYFPDLNFTLIIMNRHENEKEYVAQQKLSDDLLLISIPRRNDPKMIEIYKDYFNDLTGDRTILLNEDLRDY